MTIMVRYKDREMSRRSFFPEYVLSGLQHFVWDYLCKYCIVDLEFASFIRCLLSSEQVPSVIT